jgi:hypothetical protein
MAITYEELAKKMSDPEFLASLEADANAALKGLIDIPAGVTVALHFDGPETMNLVVPFNRGGEGDNFIC